MTVISFKVTLVRGKKEDAPIDFTMPSETTVRELKEELAKNPKLKRIHRQRQGIKYEKEVNGKTTVVRFDRDKRTLGEMGVEGHTLILKDIGMQFPYEGVFYAEYGGPAVIMALMTLRPAFIFGDGAMDKPWALAAQLGAAAWVLHYVKRILETAFVHKFSRETMPITNLFKNCGYYWGYTLLNAYVLCHPDYVAPFADDPAVLYAMAGAFAVSELLNLQTHLQLAGANTGQKAKKDSRGIAVREAVTGGLFDLVSCPNYTFEVLAWVLWSAMTNMAFGWLFGLTGLAQMTQWALQKHGKYLKQEKQKREDIEAAKEAKRPEAEIKEMPQPNPVVRRRKAIIPFLL